MPILYPYKRKEDIIAFLKSNRTSFFVWSHKTVTNSTNKHRIKMPHQHKGGINTDHEIQYTSGVIDIMQQLWKNESITGQNDHPTN